MKTPEQVLKIFIMPQSLIYPEWSSLLGDKFKDALPFKWEMTGSVDEANVIAWDGFMTAKSKDLMESVVEKMKERKQILLLQHVGQTMFVKHPYVEYVNTSDLEVVELPAGNLLPEDLLSGLDQCHKKMNHV